MLPASAQDSTSIAPASKLLVMDNVMMFFPASVRGETALPRGSAVDAAAGTPPTGPFGPPPVHEIVPGAPHSMYWETPDLFNDALRKFLAEVYA